jgi:hypothetical protein
MGALPLLSAPEISGHFPLSFAIIFLLALTLTLEFDIILDIAFKLKALERT